LHPLHHFVAELVDLLVKVVNEIVVAFLLHVPEFAHHFNHHFPG